MSDPIPQPATTGRQPPLGPPTTTATGFAGDGDVGPPPGYVVERELGRSAAGDVACQARQVLTNQPVFLRLYRRPTLLQVARVRRVAEALARVVHPGVEQVYEVGEYDGRLFIATEDLPGGSLADRLRQAPPLSSADTADTLIAAAYGLHAAHAVGLAHRDVKTANVLFTADGHAKVADFWTSRLLTVNDPTKGKAVVGTPGYMAPEQVRGDTRAVGPATDVWALGVVLYECLTGRLPWSSSAPVDMLMQAIDARPLPPREANPDIDRRLEAVCLKCLKKRPADRYPMAAALADDLVRWRTGRPVEAGRDGKVRRALAWVSRR